MSANYENEITSNTLKWFKLDYSGWFRNVYKQCTGKELNIMPLTDFSPDTPIISTIPVSITFTKVEQ